MTAISYPSTLPGPSVATIQSEERRLLGDGEGAKQTRPMQRDGLALQQLTFTFGTFEQCEIFRLWWKDTLTYGGAWFASAWPLPQGMVTGVRRFVSPPKWAYLPAAGWRVTAECQVRGQGALPNLAAPSLSFTSRVMGGAIVLSWSSGGATSLSLSTIGPVPNSGTASGTQNTSYTLTATNAEGSTVVTITTPYLPPTLELATACFLYAGFGNGHAVNSATWTSTNATSASISGYGAVSTSGYIDDPLLARSAYTLTVVGPGGSTSKTIPAQPVHWETTFNSSIYSGATLDACMQAVRPTIVAYYAGSATVGPGVVQNSLGDGVEGNFLFTLTNGYGGTQPPFHMVCG